MVGAPEFRIGDRITFDKLTHDGLTVQITGTVTARGLADWLDPPQPFYDTDDDAKPDSVWSNERCWDLDSARPAVTAPSGMLF